MLHDDYLHQIRQNLVGIKLLRYINQSYQFSWYSYLNPTSYEDLIVLAHEPCVFINTSSNSELRILSILGLIQKVDPDFYDSEMNTFKLTSLGKQFVSETSVQESSDFAFKTYHRLTPTKYILLFCNVLTFLLLLICLATNQLTKLDAFPFCCACIIGVWLIGIFLMIIEHLYSILHIKLPLNDVLERQKEFKQHDSFNSSTNDRSSVIQNDMLIFILNHLDYYEQHLNVQFSILTLNRLLTWALFDGVYWM